MNKVSAVCDIRINEQQWDLAGRPVPIGHIHPKIARSQPYYIVIDNAMVAMPIVCNPW